LFIVPPCLFVFPAVRCPCHLSFVGIVIVVRGRCHSSSWFPLLSAPPSSPTSSGSQAGWWRCVTWHPHVVIVQKWGPLQPCEQRLTVVA
jgi:hypothetical protein